MAQAWVARVGAVSGLISVVFGAVAGFIIPLPPKLDDPLQTINTYMSSHHTAIRVSQLLGAVASIFMLLFALYLWTVLRSGASGAGPVATLALVGATGSVIVGWVQSGTFLMLTTMATQNTDGGFRGLYDLFRFLTFFTVLPTAIFLAAAGALIALTAVLPRWLGWSAAALAVALLLTLFISIFSPSLLEGAIGLVLFVLFLAWVAATSIILTLSAWGSGVVTEQRPTTAGV